MNWMFLFIYAGLSLISLTTNIIGHILLAGEPRESKPSEILLKEFFVLLFFAIKWGLILAFVFL